MKNIIPLILIFTFAISCKQNIDQKNNKEDKSVIKDSLTVEIDKINEQGKIVGFSVAMVDTTGILYNEGFGFLDKKFKKSYTKGTVQNVASISKTLIGISLLKAQELGKLNLDESINNYLSFKVVNPKFPETDITLRQLVTSSLK